ncbi:SNF2-related protein, partial [Helicobacter pylori]
MFNKNTLLNHCVGAGKTYAAITSVLSQVKQGLVKKAAIVVPNYLVGQWGKEILKLAPNAYCYIADEKNTSLKERESFFYNIATNNYDFVVLGHTHLKLLQNDLDFMNKEAKEKLNQFEQKVKPLLQTGQVSPFKFMQMKNQMVRAMEFEMSQEVTTRLDIDFKKMGIDFLVIDESHFFKNLPYKTQLRGVKGLGTPSGSARAKDLLWKTKFFQTIPNAKVMFLSGTPITNSIVEVYGLLQYLAPDLLESLNINGIDDFIKDFAVAKEGFEMNLDAKTFKRTERLSEFTNLYALRSILSTFSHTVSLEDLKEQNKGIVPEIERQEHIIPRSSLQEEAYEELGDRIRALKVSARKNDNHLLILHDARSIATDVRLKNLNVEIDESETKNAYIAETIFQSYLKNNEIKGTQLVYYAINSPKVKSYNVDPTFEGQQRDIDALIEKKKQEALELNREKLVQQIIEEGVRAGKSKEEIDQMIQEATSIVSDGESNNKEKKSDDEIYNASLDNSDSLAQRGHTGFCVASNLLRHLVSKGIPQNEIAFVNDFTTNEAKIQMQERVNKGEIRLLIGSYYNMGVGLNVHERLTDIHLAECPFRPDMITQAIGRIERSGHPLMHSVKDFKGQVHYYGVKETIEANLYGLNAIKSKI